MRNASIPAAASPELALQADQLVALSGAGSADNIVIAGAGQLDLLIALTRAGFASAACQSIHQAPHLAHETADVILAPAIRGEAELRAVLRWFAPHLRRGGVFVLRPSVADALADVPLRRLLHDSGFADIETSRARDGCLLWRARKCAAALARAA